jgi:adenylate kinase
MRKFIVLLGPPGVGKGTQAKRLAQAISLPHISSGDLFRENIKNETELGKLAGSYINKGELVPDSVTISMIRVRLSEPDCEKGALLDGFPRTIIQAEALGNLLAEFGGKVDHVPCLTAEESILVERLSGRWTCRANGHIFHETHNPPRKTGECDLDGSELYQREDDRSETVARRIKVYWEQTAPLIEFYRQRGVLIEVDGARSVDDVAASLLGLVT